MNRLHLLLAVTSFFAASAAIACVETPVESSGEENGSAAFTGTVSHSCANDHDCVGTDFCEFKAPEFCGNSDGGTASRGTCTARPQFCSHIEAPVCGCDGNEYGNACNAQQAGVSIVSAGSCHADGGR